MFKAYGARIVRVMMLCVGLVSTCVMAGELIYVPTNPTFGGNPNNASGLMAIAQAQNNFKAPATNTNKPLTALEKFSQNLENAVLGRLTTTAVGSLFDADGRILPGKTIVAGNYTIAITEENGNLVMTTTDTTNPGTSTRIVVGNSQSAVEP
jgi:curli production assembly/transport component CsgF